MPVYTKAQTYAISLLRKLRSVRRDQLHWLIECEYPDARPPAVTEMRRLTHLGKAVNDGTYYYWPGCKLDADLIIALDIMWKVTGDGIPVFEIKKAPCKLLFHVIMGDNTFAFRVYFPKPGEERACRAEVEATEFPDGHAVIFYIEGRSQIPLLDIERSHIFVCPGMNGRYEYISGRP